MSSAAVVVGVASVWWPVIAVLAVLGVYLMVAPLLRLGPWRQPDEHASATGIRAGHGITAGGDIEADADIEAGHGVKAGGNIRSSSKTSPLLFAQTARQKADRAQLGLVNPLVGHFRIRQFARPLEHDEQGCVFRVVVAPDCAPSNGELTTTIKDTFKDALSQSSLEAWAREQAQQARASVDWLRSAPNTGRVATFKRDWSLSGHLGSAMSARATLELPSGPQFGHRPVLVLDIIERAAEAASDAPPLSLSLCALHRFLHTLAETAVDELGSIVFPDVCEQATPTILGPNYEIDFGDRALETVVEIPDSFERPQDACRTLGAAINTPEDSNPRDLDARDAVIRDGMQKVFRSNGYDRIETEIATLPVPRPKHAGTNTPV